jgi:hypothetical protein
MDRPIPQDMLGEHADYVRAARRLRARFGGDLAKIHASLQRLNDPSPSRIFWPIARSNDWSASAILGRRGPAARAFADRVLNRLVGPLLTWTDRQILLGQAADLGLRRFEANLIIAAVQHAQPAGGRPQPMQMPRLNLSALLASIATFLFVQFVIIAAVWRLLF